MPLLHWLTEHWVMALSPQLYAGAGYGWGTYTSQFLGERRICMIQAVCPAISSTGSCSTARCVLKESLMPTFVIGFHLAWLN